MCGVGGESSWAAPLAQFAVPPRSLASAITGAASGVPIVADRVQAAQWQSVAVDISALNPALGTAQEQWHTPFHACPVSRYADIIRSLEDRVRGRNWVPRQRSSSRLPPRQAQVRFVEGDIHDPAPGGPFDAIVERGGPVVGSGSGRGAAAAGRGAGGLVVPIEVDLSMIRWLPENPLGTRVKSWLVEALARAGMVMLGPRLWAIVEEAGLRPLG